MNSQNLFKASYSGNIEAIRKLITHGETFLDITDDTGATPLLMASGIGHTDVVKELIAAGADINITDNDGFTPLMMASGMGHTNIVEALIAAGADLNIASVDGVRPLNMANELGHTKIAELLRNAGAISGGKRYYTKKTKKYRKKYTVKRTRKY